LQRPGLNLECQAFNNATFRWESTEDDAWSADIDIDIGGMDISQIANDAGGAMGM